MIRNDLHVTLHQARSVDALTEPTHPLDEIGGGGVLSLDVGYGKLITHLERGLLITDNIQQKCAVCSRELHDPASAALVCPRRNCNAISHMACLAKHFIAGTGAESIIPLSGSCPSCQVRFQWIDFVKELSLRTRGIKEMEVLWKKSRVDKAKSARGKPSMVNLPVKSDYVNERDLSELDDTIDTESTRSGDLDHLPDKWLDQCDDGVSVASAESRTSISSNSEARTPSQICLSVTRRRTVIEDSEYDNEELLD